MHVFIRLPIPKSLYVRLIQLIKLIIKYSLPLVALVARTMSASGCPPRTSGPSLLGALRSKKELISVCRTMSSESAVGAGVLFVSFVDAAGSVVLFSLLCKHECK